MKKPVRRRISTKSRPSKPIARVKSTPSRVKRAGSKASTPSGKGYDTGAAGFAKAKKKQQRQQEEYDRKKNTPYDFRLKPGDEAEVVILDSEEPFFIPLHKVKNRQGRWEDAVCIMDTGVTCPLCSSLGKEGSYTLMLTALDRRPYKIQNGPNAGKTIKVSRKLLPVKGRNLAKFERQYKRHKGNLRGLRVNCARSGEKEAAIGEDLEFLTKVPEKVLSKYGENAVPAPYREIFQIPTAAELSERYNLDNTVAGSEEFGTDSDEDLDNVSW